MSVGFETPRIGCLLLAYLVAKETGMRAGCFLGFLLEFVDSPRFTLLLGELSVSWRLVLVGGKVDVHLLAAGQERNWDF